MSNWGIKCLYARATFKKKEKFMSKKFMKSIEKIIASSESKKVVIFTQHLKIDGEVFIPEGRCDECNEDYVTLQNALVCRLNDYCECDDNVCECNDYVCFRYDWLSVCEEKIVAFSMV